jgi:hypothetical protein
MRLGIVGAPQDAQVKAVLAALRQQGVDVAVVDPNGLHGGLAATSDGTHVSFGGDTFGDVAAWWVRGTVNPLPPTFEEGDQYVLFEDWFEEYMARRERMGFLLSWLVGLGYRGVPVVNPPEHAAAIQLKGFQLQAAVARGFEIPRTLTTNDPNAVRALVREVKDVIYKPSMGGGLARVLDAAALARLDHITRAPVTFQQHISGHNIRVTLVGDDIVSAVKIPSDAMDYRADATYAAGDTLYDHAEMTPQQADVCRAVARDVGLVVTGMDFIQRADGSWVFLEANPAPVWLDIEHKTGAPVSRALAEHLLGLARAPTLLKARLDQARRPSSFCRYAYPQDPSRSFPVR